MKITAKARAERRAKVQKYADGSRTQAEVCRMVGCSREAVLKDMAALHDAGIIVKFRKNDHGQISGVIIRKIRRLYATGDYTLQQVADLCGVSHVTVEKYKDPGRDVKQKKLPSLPSPGHTYEILTTTSRTRHTSFTKDRARDFALSLCKGREIISQGFVQ